MPYGGCCLWGLGCCRHKGLPPAGGKEIWGGSKEEGRLCAALLVPRLFGHPLGLVFTVLHQALKKGAVAGGSCQGLGPGAGLDIGGCPKA